MINHKLYPLHGLKNPSYGYTSLHVKLITKEKKVVGVPTKYYIHIGKQKQVNNTAEILRVSNRMTLHIGEEWGN